MTLHIDQLRGLRSSDDLREARTQVLELLANLWVLLDQQSLAKDTDGIYNTAIGLKTTADTLEMIDTVLGEKSN